MNQLDAILSPEITRRQPQDNTSARRDELQVEQANSRSSLDTILSPKITQQQSQDNTSTKHDELQVEQANSRSSGESESFQSSRDKKMTSSDSTTLFPDVANQQSEKNIPTRRDEQQVVQANSGPRVEVKSYLNLYQAAVKGDWGIIKSILDKNPNALTAEINEYGGTLLHVAVWMGHTSVVKRLLEMVSRDELEKTVSSGNTVLHIAAIGGDLEMIKALVGKNPRLTQITGRHGLTPIDVAAQYSYEEVVRYLWLKTNDDAPGRSLTGPPSGDVIVFLTGSGLYDVALMMLRQYPQWGAVMTKRGANLVTSLAARPSDFLSGSNFRCWEAWIYQMVPMVKKEDLHYITRSDEEDPQHRKLDNGTRLLPFRKYMQPVLAWINKLTWKVMKELVPKIKHIEQEKLKHKYANNLIHYACEATTNLEEVDFNTMLGQLRRDLVIAAQNGIVEVVTLCCQYFPTLTWHNDNLGQSLFQIAIQHRKEKILNVLYEKNAICKAIANSSNGNETLLHAAAKLAPLPLLRSIPCSAIQMQREIQWFKAVENLIQPNRRNFRNRKWETAYNLFTSQHEKLVKEAEEWMKSTSNSCMLVSTLVATVVFAAAFTVPGGNLEGRGIPIFLKESTFTTFAISDALALFSSTTSILMFLSILTARYAEQDFLYALPKRLILGLASLFLAIVAMMVAFGSALQIMLEERWKWCYIPTMVLGALPVSLFMMLQFPLFVDVIWSTYGPSIFPPERIW